MRYLHKIHSPVNFEKSRVIFRTLEGGDIAIDENLYSLWKIADNHSLDEIVKAFMGRGYSPDVIKGGVTCLVESGLLERVGYSRASEPQLSKIVPQKTVSAVIVSFNSKEWLDTCLKSLTQQTYPVEEIVLVDNGSQDDTVRWVQAQFPDVKVLVLEKARSLAYAINKGVDVSKGDLILILNPDIKLEKDSLAIMVETLHLEQQSAAVAPKLKFMWASSFINGIGNFAGPFFYGFDIGIGHLDLGQFDSIREIPSASFACLLINKDAWKKVGKIDEKFPLYYEDIDWSYRARMLSFHISFAPHAIVYHAMGSRTHYYGKDDLTPSKIQHVTIGRNRLLFKVFSSITIVWLLLTYFVHDIFRFVYFLSRFQWQQTVALMRANFQFLLNLREVFQGRKHLRSRGEFLGWRFLMKYKKVPKSRIWRGIPYLTWKDVAEIVKYLNTGNMRLEFPEFYDEK